MDGPRACLEDEFDEAISLINSVFRADTDQDIRTDYPLVFNQSGLEYMRIIRVDGRIVAHVPVSPREVYVGDDRFTVAVFSSTLSHPDYRHCGYATACLRDCVRIMEESGWPVSVLWTQVQTFPFYRNSGWEAMPSQGYGYELDHLNLFRFKRGSFEIVPYDRTNQEHVEVTQRLHTSETHRISRNREDMRILFSLPKIRVLLAVDEEGIAGYLVVGDAVNKSGLLEGGGSPEALAALVGDILSKLNPGQTLQVQTPLSPTPLGRIMESTMKDRRFPIEEAALAGYQMIRINSLAGLLRGMKCHLRERSKGVRAKIGLECSDSGEVVTILVNDGEVNIKNVRAEDSLTLNRRQLASLIFGHHSSVEPPPVPRVDILERLFPFYFPIWALDRS